LTVSPFKGESLAATDRNGAAPYAATTTIRADIRASKGWQPPRKRFDLASDIKQGIITLPIVIGPGNARPPVWRELQAFPTEFQETCTAIGLWAAWSE
jgi:hypothetical protein